MRCRQRKMIIVMTKATKRENFVDFNDNDDEGDHDHGHGRDDDGDEVTWIDSTSFRKWTECWLDG